MRESVEFIELTSLEKASKDQWLFRIKPNASFNRIFDSLHKNHVFEAVKVYALANGDCDYQINDEGIWLLSHVFSNWDEMYEQATKKSPWEENWQKRAEQDMPPEHTNYEYGLCVECGRGWIFAQHTPCSECGKPVCATCKTKHAKKHKAEQADSAEDFDRAYRLYQNGIWSAAQFQEYINEQSQQKTKQGERERGGDFYYCSGCSTYFNNAFHPPAWTCPQCQADFCPACRISHTHVRAHQTYQTRPDWSMGVDEEKFQEMLNNLKDAMDRAQEYAQEHAKAEEERLRQQEFFRDFYGSWTNEEETDAFKAHYTNSQSGTFTPPNRPVLTSEIREAFKLFSLPPAATEQEIKRKFRVLAKQAHPDAGGSEEQFKKLNNACEKALAYAKDNKSK